MPVHAEQFLDNTKVLFTFEGDMVLPEFSHSIKELAKKYAKKSKQQDVIWDFRLAKVAGLSFEAVEQLIEMFLSNDFFKGNQGQTAYVIDERAEKHLLHYFINGLQNNGYQRKLHLFHDLEQAKRFLNFPEPTIA